MLILQADYYQKDYKGLTACVLIVSPLALKGRLGNHGKKEIRVFSSNNYFKIKEWIL